MGDPVTPEIPPPLRESEKTTVVIQPTLSAEQLDAIRGRFEARHTGTERAHIIEPFDFFADQPFSLGTFVQRLVALASLEPAHPASAPVGDRGGVHQRDRLAVMAEWACRTWPGDLLETGTYGGETTERLAVIARKYGRKVKTIDCWPAEPAVYELATVVKPAAYARLAPYADVVEIREADVLTPESRAWIRERPLCFALCDTMKGHEFVRHELGSVLPVAQGLVAIDDYYVSSLARAVEERALESLGMAASSDPVAMGRFVHVTVSTTREAWLVRSDA